MPPKLRPGEPEQRVATCNMIKAARRRLKKLDKERKELITLLAILSKYR